MIVPIITEGNLAWELQYVDELDDEDDILFRQLFKSQKKRGIHKSDINAAVWRMSNGTGDRPAIDFRKARVSPKGMDIEDFVWMLKKHAIGLIANRSIVGVAHLMARIIQVANQTQGFQQQYRGILTYDEAEDMQPFLELFGIQIDEIICEEQLVSSRRGMQRELATDFWTYYIFDKEIRAFWKNASKEEKIIYGPLYLFWVICLVIPTRPKGFCIMPRDCIERIDGKIYVMLRQSEIKGSGKKVTNTIEDYSIESHRTINEIAQAVEEYRDLISEYYGDYDADRLFCNNAFNAVTGLEWDVEFRRGHLDKLKDKFIIEVLQQNKGYKIRAFDDPVNVISYTKEDWLTDWRLGDLRHLALIDLVLNVEPSVIMEIAGHSSITAACHYYNNRMNMNLSRIVYVRRKANRTSSRHVNLDLAFSPTRRRVLGGYCSMAEDDMAICARQNDCTEGCEFFEPDEAIGQGILTRSSKRINILREEIQYASEHGYTRVLKRKIAELQNETRKMLGGQPWEHQN